MLSDQEVIAEAIKVVNNHSLGLLATVGVDGAARARFLGTAAVDGIRRIYTLCGRKSRKVEQIRRHPGVCWVFCTPGFGDVVTLLGEAEVMDSPAVSQMAWDRLADAARAYAMSVVSDDANLEFATIETRVHTVELVSPRLHIFHPRVVTLREE